MESIIRNHVPVRGSTVCLGGGKVNPRRPSRGQTMTEYALILAAVAIAVFVTYETMGSNINVLAQHSDIRQASAIISSINLNQIK
jgi:Flp pilus assembly pilin Flp